MTQADWSVYAILRNIKGKAYAEEYRHNRNKRNAEYGIGLHRDNAWIVVKDYGLDGILAKQFIAGEMSIADQASFQSAETIDILETPYDCTGAAFTAWMEFYKVPGGTWVYHRIARDS